MFYRRDQTHALSRGADFGLGMGLAVVIAAGVCLGRVGLTLALAGVALHDGPWSPVWEWKPLARVCALGYGI